MQFPFSFVAVPLLTLTLCAAAISCQAQGNDSTPPAPVAFWKMRESRYQDGQIVSSIGPNLMVSGFPNMFVVTGPGSPGVKTQMIASIEQHVDWIADAIDHLHKHQLDRIAPNADAESEWVDHVNAVADSTLYPLANSWYVGANIPGKPRVFMPYVAGVGAYRKICDEVAANGYEGCTLS